MRLTSVQRDVLARMRDGWTLKGSWSMTQSDYRVWHLRKDGESARYVRATTVDALAEQGAITFEKSGIWNRIGRLV